MCDKENEACDKESEAAILGPYGQHEVVDRSSMIFELFCEKVQEHLVVENDPELKRLAEETADKLHDFYHHAAMKFIPDKE